MCLRKYFFADILCFAQPNPPPFVTPGGKGIKKPRPKKGGAVILRPATG